MGIRASKVAVSIGIAAAAGLATFAVLAWNVTSVEQRDGPEATTRFDAVRAQLGASEPILQLAPDGAVIHRVPAPAAEPHQRLTRVVVLVYHPDTRRAVESRIPFWFYRIKAPAAQYAFEGIGLDFHSLAITPADLSRYGPRVVLDHRSPAGARVLVWTE